VQDILQQNPSGPNNFRFRYMRAQSRFVRGMREQALQDFREVAREHPDYDDVRDYLDRLEGGRQGAAGPSHGGDNTETPPPKPTTSRPSDDPWEVLGVKPGASVEEIRAAYKRRCLEYHPDRVQHLGERLRAVAEDEMRRINAAYSTLVRS
jgi:DnaJ-class molecular chaperone